METVGDPAFLPVQAAARSAGRWVGAARGGGRRGPVMFKAPLACRQGFSPYGLPHKVRSAVMSRGRWKEMHGVATKWSGEEGAGPFWAGGGGSGSVCVALYRRLAVELLPIGKETLDADVRKRVAEQLLEHLVRHRHHMGARLGGL